MPKPHLITELLHDHKVASIKNSSNFVSKHICRRIDFSKNLTIIEYGPGTGALTKSILKFMNEGSKIVAIETNKILSGYLKELGDERLIVVNDNVLNVENILNKLKISKVDYIISGIPFSMISRDDKNKILEKSKSILSKDGKLLVYQVRKGIEKDLGNYFKIIDKKFEIRNIPPLVIFECGK
ncbi:methyltransferase [Candidatus Pacearchaeota archaeon]|nr:methyltransferase [Candidatus Pacearchaeota archaeon]